MVGVAGGESERCSEKNGENRPARGLRRHC
jgi:hypothetical protein